MKSYPINTTKFFAGDTNQSVAGIIAAILSGYGLTDGKGVGHGYGLHRGYHEEARGYNLLKCEEMTYTHYSRIFYEGYSVPANIINYNGAGHSTLGTGCGCGALNNTLGLRTDNEEGSWCNKLIPIEVMMENTHS